MAKGCKFTASRNERILGTCAYAHTQASTATDPSDLREEDVWSVPDDSDVNVSHDEWEPRSVAETSSVRTRHRALLDRDDHCHLVGLSPAFEDPAGGIATTASSRIVHQYRGRDGVASPRRHPMATSAPMNVPDWSKILRVDSVESLHDADDGFDESELEMVPPHEYLAREYERSRKMAANSVFEGVGRTLKGRDMRRVRDAVWNQTGFDG